MSTETKGLHEQLMTEWTNFKSENDRRLKEVETKGRADPLTEEKIEKHSAAIGVLNKQLEALTAKMNRPGVGVGGVAGELANVSDEEIEHKQLFKQFMRGGGDTARMAALQTKLWELTPTSDGGYAVPVQLDRTIGRMEIQLAPMLDVVTVMPVGNETYQKVFDLRGTTSGWVAESAARPATSTPTFALFQPSFGELYCMPLATQRMLEDVFFDAESWLAMSIAERMALDIDAAIWAGTGTNQPKGILSYTMAATTDATRAYGTIQAFHSGAAGSFTADNLFDLYQQLRPGYRQTCSWAMCSSTVDTVRKFKDGMNHYYWNPSLESGTPATLLSRPVIEDENVPAIAASSNSVVLADFKRAYKLAQVRGISVLRDPYTVKGQIAFYTRQRLGGGVEDTNAVKVLTLQV